MIKRIITIFLICLANSKSFAQQPGIYRFMSALYASIDSHYGREAMYTDPFAYKLYNNYNSIPSVGAPFDKNADSTKSVWKAVVADTAGRLFDRSGGRERRMRGQGYFYFTYTADRARTALLNVQGGSQLYFNSEPHTVDVYNSGWLYIPVQLKKGLNEIYVRGAFITAMLKFTEKPVFINTEDPTMPDRVLNQSPDTLQGAVVVINTSSKELKDLRIQTVLEGIRVVSAIPAIPAMSSRKVPFRFSVKNIHDKGTFTCKLVLMNTKTTLDENTVPVDAVSAGDKYRNTFTSKIDGSLQYYAVAPSLSAGTNQALFLSVHGAGVEAIGQARAYQSKSWGNLVAPTNRRPRGFNWEDWGRIDALEVLEKATQLFKPDPRRIYLTGHSMGGMVPGSWERHTPINGRPLPPVPGTLL